MVNIWSSISCKLLPTAVGARRPTHFHLPPTAWQTSLPSPPLTRVGAVPTVFQCKVPVVVPILLALMGIPVQKDVRNRQVSAIVSFTALREPRI